MQGKTDTLTMERKTLAKAEALLVTGVGAFESVGKPMLRLYKTATPGTVDALTPSAPGEGEVGDDILV